MGVNKLLFCLRPLLTSGHVRDLPKGFCAVDAAIWLYEAAYGCARNFVLGKPVPQVTNYVIRKALMMRDAGLAPILCFDGRRPTLKASTSDDRRTERKARLERGHELLELAKRATDQSERSRLEAEADKLFQRSCTVSFDHAIPVMQALRKHKIPYVVAPFEADAQLAALAAGGHVRSIVTADSDIIAFLVACQTSCEIMFKMNSSGFGSILRVRSGPLSTWVRTDHMVPEASAAEAAATASTAATAPSAPVSGSVSASFLPSPQRRSVQPAASGQAAPLSQRVASRIVSKPMIAFLKKLSTLQPRQFVQLCVLAGCDYLAPPPALGLRPALKYIVQTKSCQDTQRPARIVRALTNAKLKLPANYRRDFCLAEAGFYWHIVYDPARKTARHLAPWSDAAPSGVFSSPSRPMAPPRRVMTALPAPLKRAAKSSLSDSRQAAESASEPRGSEPLIATAATEPLDPVASPEGGGQDSAENTLEALSPDAADDDDDCIVMDEEEDDAQGHDSQPLSQSSSAGSVKRARAKSAPKARATSRNKAASRATKSAAKPARGTLFSLVSRMQAKAAATQEAPQLPAQSAVATIASSSSSACAPRSQADMDVTATTVEEEDDGESIDSHESPAKRAVLTPTAPGGATHAASTPPRASGPAGLSFSDQLLAGLTVHAGAEDEEDPIRAMIGSVPSPATARAMAQGELHPGTGAPISYPASAGPYPAIVSGLKAAFAAGPTAPGAGLFMASTQRARTPSQPVGSRHRPFAAASAPRAAARSFHASRSSIGLPVPVAPAADSAALLSADRAMLAGFASQSASSSSRAGLTKNQNASPAASMFFASRSGKK
jgi:5'-3' exonuclease